jgi:hypothetical protein
VGHSIPIPERFLQSDFQGRPRAPDPPEEPPPIQRATQSGQRLQILSDGSSDSSAPSVCSDSSALSARRTVFRLCRRLKLDGGAEDREKLRLLFQTHAQALAGMTFEEFRLLVAEGTERVKTPVGSGALGDALAEADSKPFPACAEDYPTLAFKRTVALCAVLQRRAGRGKPFFLAGSSLADELKVDPGVAARWLRLLVRDRVLELVQRGHRGTASEYRFIGRQ